MFQFAGLASRVRGIVLLDWVVPFGDPGVDVRLQLTRAFRSLPRPSSPTGAKASALRPFVLYSSCIRPRAFIAREAPFVSRFYLLGFFVF